jgi:hypothetical protein
LPAYLKQNDDDNNWWTQLARRSAGDRGRNRRDVKTLFREIGMLAEVFEADASAARAARPTLPE